MGVSLSISIGVGLLCAGLPTLLLPLPANEGGLAGMTKGCAALLTASDERFPIGLDILYYIQYQICIAKMSLRGYVPSLADKR